MNHTPAQATAPSFKPYRPPFERRFLAPRFWGLWLGFGVIWLLSLWPQGWRSGLAGWVGRQLYRRNRKRREIIDTNLAWCFPELDDKQRRELACEYYRYLIQSVLDYGVLWWGSPARVDRHVELRGLEHLQRQLDSDRPVIIVTGHSPGLERGGVGLALHRYPICSFANEARNPMLEWLTLRWRTRFGGYVFPRSGGFRPVIKALRQGYLFYIMADEDLGPESAGFAPFFGIPRATLTSPLRLARMTKAEVLTSFTWYDDAQQRYVMEIEPALDGITDDDELTGLTRLNQRLEQAIRRHPAQYMWSLRLFKTMQDGSPPPYFMKSRPGSGPRPRPQL